MNEIGVYLIRKEAESTGMFISTRLPCTIYKAWEPESHDLSAQDYFRSVFQSHKKWLLLMTTGIAVRFLNGQLSDKLFDPSVVVMDEACRNCISLVGGHEGGANELANSIANIVGGMPVITTASESLKTLTLGIGCRKDVTLEQIEDCVTLALQGRSSSLGLSAVRLVATVDLKQNEPAILEFCEKYNLPLQIFAAANLISRGWVTRSSTFVKEVTGADGVCEPCALMVHPRGRLVVPKTTLNGVAVAFADDRAIILDRQESRR